MFRGDLKCISFKIKTINYIKNPSLPKDLYCLNLWISSLNAGNNHIIQNDRLPDRAVMIIKEVKLFIKQKIKQAYSKYQISTLFLGKTSISGKI